MLLAGISLGPSVKQSLSPAEESDKIKASVNLSLKEKAEVCSPHNYILFYHLSVFPLVCAKLGELESYV